MRVESEELRVNNAKRNAFGTTISLLQRIAPNSQLSILNSSLALIFTLILMSCAPLPPVGPGPSPSQTSKQQPASKNITGNAAWDKVLAPWIGTPYLAGGTSKKGVDCSGFTSSVYKEKEGINLPRTSTDQSKGGKEVSKRSLAIGDVIYFGEKKKVNHVGIYVGKGNFIHASTSIGVTVTSLDDSYWKSRYMGARRYL